MNEPIWHEGLPDRLSDPGDRPAVWYGCADDFAVQHLAGRAALNAADWLDLANRPQADMRGLRRQLTKVLLAHLARCHPDNVVIVRDALGAPHVLTPAGWHISLAGRWPHMLIGVGRILVGVDIETCDARPPPEDALTLDERAQLKGAPDITLVSRWAAKEAHAKLFGVAAQVEGNQIQTQACGAHLIVHSTSGSSICYQKRTPKVICAVALPAPAP